MKTIIEMAREAECLETFGMDAFQFTVEELERFAALVLANTDPQSSMTWQEGNEAGRLSERERLLQAVEEMRPVQDNPLLQNKPPEFWIRSFKQAIEARGNA